MTPAQAITAAGADAEAVLKALSDAGFHLLSAPEVLQTQGPHSTVIYTLRARMDNEILAATLSESRGQQVEQRQAARTALGVNFAVELGKRLGVIPEDFAR